MTKYPNDPEKETLMNDDYLWAFLHYLYLFAGFQVSRGIRFRPHPLAFPCGPGPVPGRQALSRSDRYKQLIDADHGQQEQRRAVVATGPA